MKNFVSLLIERDNKQATGKSHLKYILSFQSHLKIGNYSQKIRSPVLLVVTVRTAQHLFHLPVEILEIPVVQENIIGHLHTFSDILSDNDRNSNSIGYTTCG